MPPRPFETPSTYGYRSVLGSLGVLLAAAGCGAGGRAGAPAGDGAADAIRAGGATGGGAGTGGAGGVTAQDGGGGGGRGTPAPADGGAGTSGQDGSANDAAADAGGVAAPVGPSGGVCVPGASYGNPLPVNRTATLVRGGYANQLEGPVWVAAQRALYFCEGGASVTTGRINKYTPADNMFSVFVDNVGVGGLAVDAQGMLVAGCHDTQRLSRFDPVTGQRTDVPGGSMYLGRPFNQVNDVVVRADGNMYFSDPTYQLAGRPGQGVMAFYRLSPAGEVSRILTSMDPNGVALSPDGAWLYLATSGGPRLQRFALAADGSVVGAGTMWTDPFSDGMAVDCAGNLYLSDAGQTNQIRVVSPTDQPLGSIVGLGGGFVTNSAFGGDDHKTLYITTSQAVYQIQLNVPGFPN
jgi:gluconolactonase